ncbi:MAG: phosphonate C-P lyase system protein PhnH [Halomonas sp.]|jgi:alpha-D-ribose 1-methylphosphonate 5-triphosphate synthase subunit PhnH|uniref:Phosphonate C-P lyase system protein PhnH n=1 Tax=Billgrantia tianxiuensis TaxID=2497861 RepID=A0A6I6SGX4_9GAMM|nr:MULTISPECIES: phosphonate C-P lyase system protein PhnH [Halomonas]MCE8035794.1 phosphonate C-P lyase system protein PhnH [Halomonas sp. MCCC 1A11057]MDX5434777.1 phosphonate C-P lyase system protein PhnH [Halomonas sp.]QHC48651.1 phosphonate C-P lyase system protein PhnH [Halomonas tianxiuensis]
MPWPTLNDPVHDSQRLFRQVLAAMSEPGTLHTLAAPAPPQATIGSALWGTLLTLCDLDVRVWLAPALDTPALREALPFHTGCRLTDEPVSADFALVTPAALCEAPDFALGSDEYPDRSTTLLVALELLDSGDTGSGTWQLSGPGIPAQRTLRVEERARPLMLRLAANRQSFPCGLDAILTCGERLAALPRTTRIEEIA